MEYLCQFGISCFYFCFVQYMDPYKCRSQKKLKYNAPIFEEQHSYFKYFYGYCDSGMIFPQW